MARHSQQTYLHQKVPTRLWRYKLLAVEPLPGLWADFPSPSCSVPAKDEIRSKGRFNGHPCTSGTQQNPLRKRKNLGQDFRLYASKCPYPCIRLLLSIGPFGTTESGPGAAEPNHTTSLGPEVTRDRHSCLVACRLH